MENTINILELLGTFFLAVEAIKLKNFKKFKLKLKSINSILNPRIVWVDKDDNIIDNNQVDLSNTTEAENNSINKNEHFHQTSRSTDKTSSFGWPILGLLISSGVIYFSFLYLFKLDILTFIPSEKNSLFYIPKIILGLLIGPIIWTAIIYLFELLIYLLKGIEEKTKTGVIGIIGFAFFLITFLFKTFAR